jgi:hypothetical protein
MLRINLQIAPQKKRSPLRDKMPSDLLSQPGGDLFKIYCPDCQKWIWTAAGPKAIAGKGWQMFCGFDAANMPTGGDRHCKHPSICNEISTD